MNMLCEMLNYINQAQCSILLIFYTYVISIVLAYGFPNFFYKWVCLPINWLNCTLFVFLRLIMDVSIFIGDNIISNILLGISLMFVHPLFYVYLINNMISNHYYKFTIAVGLTLCPIIYIVGYYCYFWIIDNQSYTINDVMYIVDVMLYPFYMLVASLVIHQIENLNNRYNYDEIE